MQFPSFIRPLAQSLGALLLILTCNASAFGADTYYRSNQQLTIPLLRIGDANYSNTVVTIGSVVSLQGGSPNGSEDTYNPATNQLTVPSVMAGGTHYYNAVGTVPMRSLRLAESSAYTGECPLMRWINTIPKLKY